MKGLEFIPLDKVYFRSGREIGFGTGLSLFPPPSPVMRGVLRGIYLSENPQFLPRAKRKEKEPSLEIEIKGIFVKYEDEILFPAPLDLYEPKKEEGILKPCSLVKKESPSSYPLSHLLKTHQPGDKPQGFLAQGQFQDYLEGRGGDFYPTPRRELLVVEEKVGIKRDFASRTTQEEALFSQGFLRLKEGVSFVVWYDGPELPQEGMAKLGADGRIAHFRKIQPQNIQPPSPSRIFKIYLSTPAIFEKGWLPSWIGEDFVLKRGPIRAKLIAASVGRAEFYSGWDMAEGRPKPNFKAVPAGSVYYFSLIEGSFQQVLEEFHGKIISDKRPEDGFGLSFVGGIR